MTILKKELILVYCGLCFDLISGGIIYILFSVHR